MEELRNEGPENISLVVAGNKKDLHEKRVNYSIKCDGIGCGE